MNNNTENLPAEYMSAMKMIQREESIKKGVLALKDKILVSAGEEFLSWPEEKQNQFLERTIMAIAKNEKLTGCFESPEGKLSIIEAVEKAVSTGLQIGGKQAYLVPQPETVIKNKKEIWVTKIRFSIKDVGYYALLCGGKKPIFLDLRWSIVYEKDDCSVDAGTGIVNHKKSISEDKGKIIGCWVQAKKMNNQLEAEFFSVSKINEWRDSSKAYQKNKSFPWKEWYDEMAIQASIRHFCNKYEQSRELLAAAIYDDEQLEEIIKKSSIDFVDAALTKSDTKPEEEKKEKKDKQKKEKKQDEQEDVDDPELF